MPWIADDHYLIPPIHVSTGYALSLSTTQLVGILMIALLTWTNTRGLEYGKIIQNVFTTAKTGALARADPRRRCCSAGITRRWPTTSATSGRARGTVDIVPGPDARSTAFGLFVAICVSQTGSLFSADAWNNITFTAGEVKDPRRNIPLSLALGTFVVIGLYLLANVAYLVTLPFDQIQHAPGDRVATATLERDLSRAGRDDHGDRHHDLDLRLHQRPDSRRRARLLRDGARRPVLPIGRAS